MLCCNYAFLHTQIDVISSDPQIRKKVALSIHNGTIRHFLLNLLSD